jgi:nucleoside-diphosphate-sugar epimerase
MIKNGKFPLLGDGSNRRSMGYVDSLAQGLLLCGGVPDAAGRTYWLADERAYPMSEIVATVKAVLKEDFGIAVSSTDLCLPSVIADIARIIDAGLQAAGLYHQKMHVLSEMNLTIACNISRAKAELGYSPLVDLREGMRRSIAWCLKQGYKI